MPSSSTIRRPGRTCRRSGSSGRHAPRRHGRLRHQARRRNGAGSRDGVIGSEEDQDHSACRARCAGCHEPAPSFSPQRLSDLLAGGPGVAARAGHAEPRPVETLHRSEVGHSGLWIDLPRPQGSGQGMVRRDAGLGEKPVPLCPDGGLVVGEVERPDDGPRCQRLSGGGSARRSGSRPRSVCRYQRETGTGVPSTGSATGYAAPGSSRLAMTRLTRTNSPRAISSIGFSSPRASTGFINQTGM